MPPNRYTTQSVHPPIVNLANADDETTKGPTDRQVYERDQYFLQTDLDLQDIANDFTPEMFTVKGIEVLGTPLDTHVYIRDFVDQNCIKAIWDVEKFEPLTRDFTHFQLYKRL
jgi:hypothetical protein